jgi:hypothetical protein
LSRRLCANFQIFSLPDAIQHALILRLRADGMLPQMALRADASPLS